MAQPLQRPALGVVRFYNFMPEGASFLDDVLQGLALPRKTLPSQYRCDARGRALLEKIVELPDYQRARAEFTLMREHGAAMAKFLGPDCQLIELGNCPSRTTHLLIERLQPPLYVPIDIDGEVMRAHVGALAHAFPWLNVNGVCADYAKLPTLPEFVGVPIRKKVVYCPGTALGNFTPQEMLELLQFARRTVGLGGSLLIGVELKKDQPTRHAAYADAVGVIAAFNLNLLARINRELGGDFQLQRFRHRAVQDADLDRVELQVESVASQFVHVGGTRSRFEQGETLFTGAFCRYGIDEFRALAQRAGFAPAQAWIDDAADFSVHALIAV